MEVLHSSETSIDRQHPASNELFERDDLLAGAVERTGRGDDLAGQYYELFSVHDLDTILQENSWFALGNYPGMIEEALLERHRADTPKGCSVLQRVEDYMVASGEYRLARRQRTPRKKKVISGWLVHERPYVEEANFEQLRQLTCRVGTVLISRDGFENLGDEEDWAEEGFTTLFQHIGSVYRVNYNPKAIRRRPYMQKKREVQRRMTGEFPKEVRHELTSCLHPGQWPQGHPYKGMVPGWCLYDSRGWGHHVAKDFDIDDILKLRELTLKLWPGECWWRDVESYNGSGFKRAVTNALLHLHCVEDQAREEKEKLIADAKEEYARMQKERDLPEESTEEKYLQHALDRRVGGWCDVRLRFCRWLRTEARALKIPMPPRPVLPLSPATEERLRRQKLKARREAARQRRQAKKEKAKSG